MNVPATPAGWTALDREEGDKCVVCPQKYWRRAVRPDGVTLCARHYDTPETTIRIIRGLHAMADAIRRAASKGLYEEVVEGLSDRARGTVANLAAHSWIVSRRGEDAIVSGHDGESYIVDQSGRQTPTDTPHLCGTCGHWGFDRKYLIGRDHEENPPLCGAHTDRHPDHDFPSHALDAKKLNTVWCATCPQWMPR